MSTRTALALVGVIIILGLGVFLLRHQAEAPTTNETPASGQLPPTNVPPANPTLLPPMNVPPAGAIPAPVLPTAVQPPSELERLCSNQGEYDFVTQDGQRHAFRRSAATVQRCDDGKIWKVTENGAKVPDAATFYFDKNGVLLDICQALFWTSGCKKYGQSACEQKNYCEERTTTGSTTPPPLTGAAENPAVPISASAMTIRITASGFSPATVSVAQGTRVTFRNESSGDSWPASAMHPTHKLYPGSDILKCSTTEKNAIFDACGGVAPGASWSFTMSERGSWKYHDHLSPSRTGTIVVE